MKKYSVFAFCAILFLTGGSMKAQPFEQSRTIEKSFPVSGNTSVDITHKYGDVQVVPWEKDSVKITSFIKATCKKLTDAQKSIDNVDLKCSGTPYYVNIAVQFKNSRGAWQESLSDFTSSLLGPGNRIEITTVIMMPAKNQLSITNKYGNVFIADHKAPLKINLSNGDLKAMNLSGESTFDLSFCNASVSSLGQAKISAGYSEITIKKVDKISLDSRSSKYWISRCGSVDGTSRRDKINVDTLGSFSGQSDFTSLNIGILNESINLKSFYGDLKISLASPSFKFIQLNSEYTDITLGFLQSAAFSFTADYKRSTLMLPAAYTALKKEIINEKDQICKTTGFVNSESQPAQAVQINALSGTITLISK